MLVPAVAVAGPVLTIARSARAMTAVVEVAVLLPGVGSVVVELAVAVLTSVLPSCALGLTNTTMVAVAFPPAAMVPNEADALVPLPMPEPWLVVMLTNVVFAG